MDDGLPVPVVAVLPGQAWRIDWLNEKGRKESNDQRWDGWFTHPGRCDGMWTDDEGNLQSLAETDDKYRLVQPLKPFHL